jgi:hypothetical protein
VGGQPWRKEGRRLLKTKRLETSGLMQFSVSVLARGQIWNTVTIFLGSLEDK